MYNAKKLSEKKTIGIPFPPDSFALSLSFPLCRECVCVCACVRFQVYMTRIVEQWTYICFAYVPSQTLAEVSELITVRWICFWWIDFFLSKKIPILTRGEKNRDNYSPTYRWNVFWPALTVRCSNFFLTSFFKRQNGQVDKHSTRWKTQQRTKEQ